MIDKDTIKSALAPAQIFTPLEWSEEFLPNKDCNYNHVIAKSPFGRFCIKWKSWKESTMFTLENSFLTDDFTDCATLREAKECAQTNYLDMLMKTLAPQPAPAPVDREAALVEQPVIAPVIAPELITLKKIAQQLRKAGAIIPIDNKGTIESAMRGGLSIALLLIEDAIIEQPVIAPVDREAALVEQPTKGLFIEMIEGHKGLAEELAKINTTQPAPAPVDREAEIQEVLGLVHNYANNLSTPYIDLGPSWLALKSAVRKLAQGAT